MESEAEISARLSQNAQGQSYTTPTPAGDPQGDPAFQSNVSLGDPVVSTQLHDYFDLGRADKYSEERQHQLKAVLEWASNQAQSNEVLDILKAVQMKELELGYQPMKDRLQRLYKLAKLEAQANFIQLERQQLYGS